MTMPAQIALMLGFLAASPAAQAQPARAPGACGEVVAVATSGGAVTRYALTRPTPTATSSPPVALLLLPGGDGNIDLDETGCPQALRGNSLVRSMPLFQALGFATALVDAPSRHKGEDGLGGHRGSVEHARDLGLVVADLRARTQATVWVVGTSRGAISAVNLAASGAGSGRADGLVLTSILMVGQASRQRPWLTQTVFDHRLEAIAILVLLVGHALDVCVRSPASQMDRIARRLAAPRAQVVVVTGGPGGQRGSSIEACEGRSPHGFVEQEREVAEGIARFVRGGRY